MNRKGGFQPPRALQTPSGVTGSVLDSLNSSIDLTEFDEMDHEHGEAAEISIRGRSLSRHGPLRRREANLHPEGGSRIVPVLARADLRQPRLAGAWVLMGNDWLAERLAMGHGSYVSTLVHPIRRDKKELKMLNKYDKI